MQAVKGYLENGRFTPYEAITLPIRAEVMLIFREAVISPAYTDEKAFWDEFDHMTAESANENELLMDEAFSRRPSGREDFEAFLDEGGIS